MSLASKLTPDQIDALKSLAAGGGSMADLQGHIKEHFGISVTYMETRLLVLDLGIELVADAKPTTAAESTVIPETPAAPAPTGAVSVTMDSISLPGALVSGKVIFSDGQTGIWMLDQTGRLGLDSDSPGYRPNPHDMTEFQAQLRNLMRSSGF